MRRIAFYPVGGERVSLPERHIKAYVDDYCHEFGQTDTDSKLMHLLYVADKGFDILSHIREFLDNHPEIAQDSIKQTLAYFVEYGISHTDTFRKFSLGNATFFYFFFQNLTWVSWVKPIKGCFHYICFIGCKDNALYLIFAIFANVLWVFIIICNDFLQKVWRRVRFLLYLQS